MLIVIDGRRAQADLFGLAQSTRDEDFGHDDGLILQRVVLADPVLPESQLLSLDDQLEVLIVLLSSASLTSS